MQYLRAGLAASILCRTEIIPSENFRAIKWIFARMPLCKRAGIRKELIQLFQILPQPVDQHLYQLRLGIDQPIAVTIGVKDCDIKHSRHDIRQEVY